MCVDGPELEDGLRSRCPRLKQLVLDTITLQGGAHIRSISIRSHSLERLTITAPSQLQGCVEIDTPELQAFCPRNVSGFYIAAPKLLEVDWSINYFYYSSRQCFAENGRYLQRLVVSANYPGFLMMQRFETVKELELIVCIKKGVQEYRRFLEVINKVAKCEVLVVKIMKVEHAYRPMLLHHLGKCPELRKVVVQFGSHKDDYPCESYSGCPCSWLENRKTNYLVLNSLEQVAIEDPDDYGNAADKVDLVRLFGKISARCEKRVSITVSEGCKATREKISSICPPNDKVEILVRST